MPADWQPLIAAVAILIVALAGQLPTIVLLLRNHDVVTRVEQQTNGQLAAAHKRIEDLEQTIADMRGGPPRKG